MVKTTHWFLLRIGAGGRMVSFPWYTPQEEGWWLLGCHHLPEAHSQTGIWTPCPLIIPWLFPFMIDSESNHNHLSVLLASKSRKNLRANSFHRLCAVSYLPVFAFPFFSWFLLMQCNDKCSSRFWDVYLLVISVFTGIPQNVSGSVHVGDWKVWYQMPTDTCNLRLLKLTGGCWRHVT